MGRIEWKPTSNRGWTRGERGYVAGIQLFSCTWDVTAKVDSAEKWHLATTLPGFKPNIYAESPEAAKELAERMLTRFGQRVYGIEPDPAAVQPTD